MQNKVADSQSNTTHRLPSRYKLRCKSIPRKYLDRKGCVYGIEWEKKMANKTFDVTDISYTSLEHTEENIRTVFVRPFIISVKSTQGCPKYIRREIAVLAKYTELWAVYPGYKRRVW